MKIIDFPEANHVWLGHETGEGEPDVQDLPSYKDDEVTVSLWKCSLWERIRICLTGKIWLHVWTGSGRYLPIALDVHNPFKERKGNTDD